MELDFFFSGIGKGGRAPGAPGAPDLNSKLMGPGPLWGPFFLTGPEGPGPLWGPWGPFSDGPRGPWAPLGPLAAGTTPNQNENAGPSWSLLRDFFPFPDFKETKMMGGGGVGEVGIRYVFIGTCL